MINKNTLPIVFSIINLYISLLLAIFSYENNIIGKYAFCLDSYSIINIVCVSIFIFSLYLNSQLGNVIALIICNIYAMLMFFWFIIVSSSDFNGYSVGMLLFLIQSLSCAKLLT